MKSKIYLRFQDLQENTNIQKINSWHDTNNGWCHNMVDNSNFLPKKNMFIKVPITAIWISLPWIRETQKKTIFDFILPLFVNSPWNCWIMRYRPVRVRIFERDYSWISSPDGWRNSVALSTWNSNFQSVINYYSAVVSEISEQNSAKWACDFTTSFTDSGYRERTIEYRQEHTLEEASRTFKVSISTIRKWEK